MEHPFAWPPILFRKWLVYVMAALGILLIGSAVSAALRDATLLTLSALLFAAIALRCYLLYRLFAAKKYETMEGTCWLVTKAPLLWQWSLFVVSEDGSEHVLLAAQAPIIEVGDKCRVYCNPLDHSGNQVLAIERITDSEKSDCPEHENAVQ